MPLNVDVARVMEEALNANLMSVPRKTNTPHSNKTKHFPYHQNIAHTTKEYVALKDKIGELVQGEHLKGLMKYDNPRHATTQEPLTIGRENKGSSETTKTKVAIGGENKVNSTTIMSP